MAFLRTVMERAAMLRVLQRLRRRPRQSPRRRGGVVVTSRQRPNRREKRTPRARYRGGRGQVGVSTAGVSSAGWSSLARGPSWLGRPFIFIREISRAVRRRSPRRMVWRQRQRGQGGNVRPRCQRQRRETKNHRRATYGCSATIYDRNACQSIFGSSNRTQSGRGSRRREAALLRSRRASTTNPASAELTYSGAKAFSYSTTQYGHPGERCKVRSCGTAGRGSGVQQAADRRERGAGPYSREPDASAVPCTIA